MTDNELTSLPKKDELTQSQVRRQAGIIIYSEAWKDIAGYFERELGVMIRPYDEQNPSTETTPFQAYQLNLQRTIEKICLGTEETTPAQDNQVWLELEKIKEFIPENHPGTNNVLKKTYLLILNKFFHRVSVSAAKNYYVGYCINQKLAELWMDGAAEKVDLFKKDLATMVNELKEKTTSYLTQENKLSETDMTVTTESFSDWVKKRKQRILLLNVIYHYAEALCNILLYIEGAQDKKLQKKLMTEKITGLAGMIEQAATRYITQ